MVTSIKDTRSVGVGLGYAAEAGDSLFKLRDGKRWFVAQTLCNRERLAFRPRFHKTVRHSRSLREVIAPVFSGYIFVVLNPKRDRWRSINGSFGVARLISAPHRPTPVPMGVVGALLASIDELGLVRFDGDLKPGQPVRVVAGSFAQVLGVLQRPPPRGAFKFC